MSSRVTVPLAVDAQPSVYIGPWQLPLRAIALLGISSPLVLVCLQLSALPLNARVGLALTVVLFAVILAAPMREGIWWGTWLSYGVPLHFMPTLSGDGGTRAAIRALPAGIEVTRKGSVASWARFSRLLAPYTVVPDVRAVTTELLRYSDGRACCVLACEGPVYPPHTSDYATWCASFMRLLGACECPVQLITLIDRSGRDAIELAFHIRTAEWPPTPLLELERMHLGEVADAGLVLRHYLILNPGSAASDGIPAGSRLTRAGRRQPVSDDDVRSSRAAALRVAAGAGVAIRPASVEELRLLLQHTVLAGGTETVSSHGLMRRNGEQEVLLTLTRLPPVLSPGALLESLIRSGSRGLVSVHLSPVASDRAQRLLLRRIRTQRYLAERNGDGITEQVDVADSSRLLAGLASRSVSPWRIAITAGISGATQADAEDGAQRLALLLTSQGFGVTPVTRPAFVAAMALTPGGAPLGRSLVLTTDETVQCLLPMLGMCFADPADPFIGISETNGAPAFLSIWKRPNHNVFISGSSGSGKSVASKTLLARHVMAGASAVVLDPDSEYARVMNAIGGHYVEAGDVPINPLAVGLAEGSADAAASAVLPILSVMAGDEKEVRNGHTVRRLPDEDQAWLHSVLAAFYEKWQARDSRDPLLSDLLDFIAHARTPGNHRLDLDRTRLVTARIRRFTQGDRGALFNRPSKLLNGERAVAIGLRSIAMSYGADLTPVLAVVLTQILARLRAGIQRLIVLVDEAHRVMADPDAGAVLAQLVRQARKHGAGVWMCSQRIDDFTATELGRTLAATASTKVILGTEEAALAELRSVLALDEQEANAICPPVPGRCVLISGQDRAVVRLSPGPGLLAVSHTGTPDFWASSHLASRIN